MPKTFDPNPKAVQLRRNSGTPIFDPAWPLGDRAPAGGYDFVRAGYESRQGAIDWSSRYNFVGAFRLSRGIFGAARASFSRSGFWVSSDGIWVNGFRDPGHNAIGKFELVTPVNTGDITQTPIADNIEPFVVIEPGPFDQSEPNVSGIWENPAGDLYIGIMGYYSNASDDNVAILAPDGTQSGYFQVPGRSRQALAWAGEVPAAWQSVFGTTHYMGNSSLFPINARQSVTPTLYGWDGSDLSQSVEIMRDGPFFQNGVSEEGVPVLFNNEKSNFNAAWFDGDDFIVIGRTDGILSGLGYKLRSGGWDTWDPNEEPVPYYMRFSRSSIESLSSVTDYQPDDHGYLNLPVPAGLDPPGSRFQVEGAQKVGTKLYVTCKNDQNSQSGFEKFPVVYVFEEA